MKIRRSRRLLIQPVQYESIEVFAEIEFDRSEVDERVDVSDWADRRLDELLEPEIAAAAAVTSNSKSFISTYRYHEED